MEAHGYFRDNKGNKSSSRLAGFLVICYAMLMSSFIVTVGMLIEHGNTVAISGSAAGFFTTVAGGAMVFMFRQKRTEEGK